MNHADDGKPVFRLFILHAVPSDEKDAGFPHLIEPSLKNLPEYRHVHRLCREADNVHCSKRPSSHGVDVTQGVCDRYLSECIRFVHDGRKKIHRLDNSQIVAEFINSGVLRSIPTIRFGSEINGKSRNASLRSPGPILQAQPAPCTVSVRRIFGFSSMARILQQSAKRVNILYCKNKSRGMKI